MPIFSAWPGYCTLFIPARCFHRCLPIGFPDAIGKIPLIVFNGPKQLHSFLNINIS
jgi:hypothetical protein